MKIERVVIALLFTQSVATLILKPATAYIPYDFELFVILWIMLYCLGSGNGSVKNFKKCQAHAIPEEKET